MNKWYFTSDLHLSHQTILRGFRGEKFKNIGEHNHTIIQNLISLPRGSNLAILGDLFWKCDAQFIKDFFDLFQKRQINIHIIIGNHDKKFSFHKAIKSVDHLKEIKIDHQSIIISHYNMSVWNKSHYNSWLLYGHTHMNDATYNKASNLNPNDTYFTGKKLNVNPEFHDFIPWSFEELKEYMDKRDNNWDFIDKSSKVFKEETK